MQILKDISPENKEIIDIATIELREKNSEPLQTVVAVARTQSGQICRAINLYHFTGGPCAEGVLMANTLYKGDPLSVIVAMHYTDNGEAEIINPCGRCRQMFNDYDPAIQVIVDDNGNAKIVTISELLPYSYRNKAVEYKRDVAGDKE